jgi:hypothetical protein
MGELVCLQCGREYDHDWAPCPHCGWKAPNGWEDSAEESEEGISASRYAVLAKPRKWIRWAAFGLLGLGLLCWVLK